jgi:hypothetical protein
LVVNSFSMRRLLFATALVCVLVLVVSTGVNSGIPTKDELLIEVMGDQQVVGTPFEIRIKNNGDRRLTFCLQTCGRNIASADAHPLPAFAVQTRVRKKWSKEILGCDPTTDANASILHGGEVQVFHAKVLQPGKYRLYLSYKEVSVEPVGAHCEAIKDGKAVQQVVTDEFEVMAAPK